MSGPIRYWNATPYMTWSFDIQHELPSSVLLDVGYVGTKGTHLYFGGAGSIDYLPASIGSLKSTQIAQLFAYVPNPFYGVITNPASTLSASTVQAYRLQRPYRGIRPFWVRSNPSCLHKPHPARTPRPDRGDRKSNNIPDTVNP